MKRRLLQWLYAVLAIVLAIVLATIDATTGHELSFFVFYFLPVSFVAWHLGFAGGVGMAIFCGLLWSGADFLAGHRYASEFYSVWNGGIRLVSFLAMSWTVSKIRSLVDLERQTTETLRRTLAEVKVLESFLPICAQCKKIQNQQGDWQQMEVYIGQHAGTRFSHGYCPECARKFLEDAGLTDDEAAH